MGGSGRVDGRVRVGREGVGRVDGIVGPVGVGRNVVARVRDMRTCPLSRIDGVHDCSSESEDARSGVSGRSRRSDMSEGELARRDGTYLLRPLVRYAQTCDLR